MAPLTDILDDGEELLKKPTMFDHSRWVTCNQAPIHTDYRPLQSESLEYLDILAELE